MKTSDYIASLQSDKENLVSNLNEKGVEATNEETFTSLVPKVLDIKSGGDAWEYFTEEIDGGRLQNPLYFIKKIPPFIFNGDNAGMMFMCLYEAEYIDLSRIDTNNCTIMENMFSNCKKIKELDLSKFNTSKCTWFRHMFGSCESLINLDLSNFDFSKGDHVDLMFANCINLTNLIFGENMGEGFTEKQNNYNSYRQGLSTAPKLTHDSLMDVINKLYDLHLTYPNTLYTQQLILGDNKAKLTATEIKIATDKGWTVV